MHLFFYTGSVYLVSVLVRKKGGFHVDYVIACKKRYVLTAENKRALSRCLAKCKHFSIK